MPYLSGNTWETFLFELKFFKLKGIILFHPFYTFTLYSKGNFYLLPIIKFKITRNDKKLKYLII